MHKGWALIVLLSLGLARAAHAEPAGEAEAKQRFFQGVALARAGNCEAAMAEFEASLTLMRRPSTLFNIARCQEKLGRYDAAVKAYEEYLALAPQNDPDRAAAEAVISALRQLLGTLIIESNLPGEVWLGDRKLGDAPGQFLVPGGRHSLEVRRDRYNTVRRQVDLAGRQSKTVKVELVELETIVVMAERRPWVRPLLWTGVTATAATAALGLGFGLHSYQQYKNAKDRDPRLPVDGKKNDIERSKTVADVFYVTAGVFAIGTTVLYFVTKDPEATNLPVKAMLGTDSVGLAFEGKL